MLTRRHLLSLTGSAATMLALGPARLALADAPTDARFVLAIQRGAMDGLHAVPPYGDPNYKAMRADLALPDNGAADGVLDLDGKFGLHPKLPELKAWYDRGELAVVHAVATPYRERSHFDGQDVLESGINRPGVVDSGWLNRALLALEPDGRVNPDGSRAISVGAITPLVVRGQAPILSWAPQKLLPASEDTQARLLDLYQHTDPKLASALQEQMRMAALGGAGVADPMSDDASLRPPGAARIRAYFAEMAGAAARFLGKTDGPRVGALGFVGWDTHINEGAASGQLANLLGALDGALAAIEIGMGEAWRDTAVAVVTEFGRTARINGTDGTDHGTATVAFLAGGALRGGRVVADWPGLKPAQLYEARDLKPTTDLRAVLKGLLRDHLRVPESALASSVFPDSADVRPIAGLV